MTAEDLKKSILQQAIQGKLVTQNLNDEPASILLDRIRAVKARLVVEGKIKCDKNESVIYRSDDGRYIERIGKTETDISEKIPFEIPNSWEWVRVKSVGICETGTTPSKGHPEYFGDYIPFLGPANIQNNQIISVTQGLSLEGSKFGRIVPKDTILQVCIGGSIGKCAIVDKEATFNQQINSVTPIIANVEYLFACLQSDSFFQQIKIKSTGTATPIINRSNWELLLIPLPPLAEQKRIVEKIVELMPLVDEYGKAQSRLDELNSALGDNLRKSVLQYAIQGKLVPQNPDEEPASILLDRIREEKARIAAEGKVKQMKNESVILRSANGCYIERIGKTETDITDKILFDIPDSWEWTKIGEIFFHNNGKQLNKNNSSGQMMDYITTSNLYWDGFKLDNLKQMPFEITEIERCQAIKGDLLVCEGGDVGRSCIWDFDYPIMLQNHIHKLRGIIPVETKYFYYVLYLYNLMDIIGGKGIGIQGFSGKALHNTLIPLPPLSEQRRIVERIEQIFSLCK